MMACSPIRTCVKYMARTSGTMQRLIPRSTFGLYYSSLRPNYVAKTNPNQSLIRSDIVKQRTYRKSLTFKNLVYMRRFQEMPHLDISLRPINTNSRLLFVKQGITSRRKSSLGTLSWMQGCALAGLVVGLSFYSSTSEPALCYSKDNSNLSTGNLSHGKQVETNYSVIEIPGDGRCLFRAIAHGACVRSGKPAPSESHQRELADELRAKVADEFVKRRKETEWFIEGDFDTYVSHIRKTHVWGGEPELLMASHVLRMPITVYMSDPASGGLVSVAEYGQEYSKQDPIRVLYDGSGHYDALHIPIYKDPRSRL